MNRKKVDKVIGIAIATAFTAVMWPWMLYVLYDERKKWKEHGPK